MASAHHPTEHFTNISAKDRLHSTGKAATDLDGHGDGGARVFVPASRAGRDDGALAHLLLRLFRDEDAALRLGRRLRPLDEHAVEQRQESLQGAGLRAGWEVSERDRFWANASAF